MKTILTGALISMLGTLIGTRFLIAWLVKRQFGQFIRDDGPTTHHTKRGTPTMGGIIIIVSVLLGYFLSHLINGTRLTMSGLLVLGLFTAMGFVGFLDDWIKISRQRSLGLNARTKLALQTAFAATFGVLALSFPDERGITPASQYVSFLRDLPWLALPAFLAVVWIMFMIAAFSNGVNLTDGLDGLATGSATMVFAVYGILNIWQFNQWCSRSSSAGPRCYQVRDPHDLALVALALAGACFGFLWWNAKPAKIILGDTGSLAIGAAVAAMAVFTRTELLSVVIGALFVVETLSVALQVGYFKASKGRRIFKMAPLHHHFELVGWQEVTVVVRFWIMCGVAVTVGMGLFYAEWVAGQ